MVARRTTPIAVLIALIAVLSACSGQGSGGALSAEAQVGQGLFTQQCASCHATQPDLTIVGPSLAGIAQTAASRVPGQSAADYIETSIRQPDAYINEGFPDVMPKTFAQIFEDHEIDALVAYLLTLE
ncbi:MAG: cytochrome c [Chloroflexi bacterium]|nr:cytochrome c [Chloroflexota bacterium]